MSVLLNWLWLGAVVAVCAEGLIRLGALAPRLRYRIWCAASVIVLLLPLVPFLVDLLRTLPAPASDTAAGPVFVVSVAHRSWMTSALLPSLAVLWTAVSLVRLVRAARRLRLARTGATAFPQDLEATLTHWRSICGGGRRARLVISDQVGSAAVFGGRQPLIAVAPRLLAQLDPADLDRIVVHEWAHVQRRDDVAHLMQLGLRAIAGWHPALWWIGRRAHLERELACDAEVLRVTGSSKAYASCLVAVAALAPRSADILPAPAALAAVSLRTRVLRILALSSTSVTPWSLATARLGPVLLASLALALTGLAGVEIAAVERATGWSVSTIEAAAQLVAPAFAQTEAPRPATSSTRNADPAQVRPADVDPRLSSPADTPPQVTPPSVASLDITTLLPFATDEVVALEAAPRSADVAIQNQRTPEPELSRPVDSETASSSPGAAGLTAPWTAAADAGVAIGQGSRKGAIAAAGLFTRVGKKIAGSF